MESSQDIPQSSIKDTLNFVDPEFEENQFLLKQDAVNRALAVRDVSYKLAVSLMSGGGSYHGTVEVAYT
jgi:hypothetical protein